ncbi:hypothetical protein ACI77O_11975 [Pseudomonas tritici]|uniref:hypothetical protein n=1 Tax=Pseudomonas tritici TaxID=2745518 RepID=UPI00387AB0D8
MELRVTTESNTYVYATSTLQIAGLEPEDFVILVFPVAALNTAGFQPLFCIGVGIFCLWLYKNMTGEQPPGFLPILVSLSMGRLYKSLFVQRVLPLRYVMHLLVKGINNVWIKSGLLPLPNYCNLYER